MSTSATPLRIDYLEFATRDLAASRDFFAAAFGWKFTDYGPDYTSFTDGRISGGLFTSPQPPTAMNPMTVLNAVDLEAAEQRVLAAGGRIVRPAFEFPGGRRFHFTDPTGLELSVWSERRADGSPIA